MSSNDARRSRLAHRPALGAAVCALLCCAAVAAAPAAGPKKRYLSPYEGVTAWIEHERSALTFAGKTRQEHARWRQAFEARLRHNLGRMPDRVPLDAEVLERVDCGDYTREKVIYNTEKYASVPAYVLLPKDLKPGERRPGILAAHGHGRGKADVCAVTDTPEQYQQSIAPLNYDYAVQLVRRGYVVIAPDWRGFGERASPAEWARAGRDPCNVNAMAVAYLGYSLLALDVWDGMRTLDYLQSRPEVDPKRLGVAGLSFGGTMATYLAALDPRVKVACISGYVSTIKGDAMGMRGLANFCGSQHMPGLLALGDIPEVAGLIAPKPLVVEMGEKDQCFVIEDMKRAYAQLQRIYAAAGASDRLAADIHPGPHAWSGRVAFDWFKRWLGR